MPIALLFPALLEAEAKTSSPDLTRYVFVCAGMLGLVLVLAYGFRKLMSSNLKRRAAGRSLQVVDMLPMGGKQRLVVVRCYDRHFLIGMGDKEMSSIAELEAGSDELPSDSVFEQTAADSPVNQRGFKGALESVMSKWKRPREVQVTPGALKPVPQAQPARRPAAKPAPAAKPRNKRLAKGPKSSADWNREEGILG